MATEAETIEPELKHSECVQEAAVNIFGTTCKLAVTPHDETQVGDSEVVIAIISLVGQIEWSVFIGLPRATACACAANFAGFEIPFESGDMGDAVGELANIIAGDVKARLDAKGVKADISLPMVIRAQGIQVLVQRNAKTIKQCYTSEPGPLWIGVTAGKGHSFVM